VASVLGRAGRARAALVEVAGISRTPRILPSDPVRVAVAVCARAARVDAPSPVGPVDRRRRRRQYRDRPRAGSSRRSAPRRHRVGPERSSGSGGVAQTRTANTTVGPSPRRNEARGGGTLPPGWLRRGGPGRCQAGCAGSGPATARRIVRTRRRTAAAVGPRPCARRRRRVGSRDREGRAPRAAPAADEGVRGGRARGRQLLGAPVELAFDHAIFKPVGSDATALHQDLAFSPDGREVPAVKIWLALVDATEATVACASCRAHRRGSSSMRRSDATGAPAIGVDAATARAHPVRAGGFTAHSPEPCTVRVPTEVPVCAPRGSSTSCPTTARGVGARGNEHSSCAVSSCPAGPRSCARVLEGTPGGPEPRDPDWFARPV